MKHSNLILAFFLAAAIPAGAAAAQSDPAPANEKAKAEAAAKAKAEAEAKAKAEAAAKAKAEAEAKAKAEAAAKAKAEAEAKAKAEAAAKAKAEAEAKAKAAAAAKAKAEAEAKAKAAAAAKARAEAEAKAKAEREIREKQAKLWQEYCTHRGKLSEEVRDKKFADAHKRCGQMMVLLDGIHKLGPCPWMREWNFTGFFAKVQKQNAEQLKKYYEFLIARASGDIKADWTTEYAALLQSQQLASDETIAKLRAGRYAIKDLSETKRFQMLVGDNELEKAEAVAQKILAGAKDPQQKIGMIRGFIRDFSAKKVFGSDLANKYYKLLLAELAGDAKAEAVQEYAAFLKKYVIVSDEEAEKLLASRYAIPGLTKMGLAKCLMYDIKATDGSDERKAAYLSGLEKIKDDTSARVLCFYSNLTGGTAAWRSDFYINVIFKDDAVIHSGDTALYDRMLGYFNGNGYVGVIPQTERFLFGEQVRTQKELADAQAVSKAARDAVYAAKVDADAKNKALKDAEAKQKENRDSKNTGALQQARNQAWDAYVKASHNLKEKESALRTADMALNIAARRFHSVCSAQERFYVRIAQRYYDTPDPVYIRKAIDALMRKYESAGSDPVSRMDVLLAIARLAVMNAEGRVNNSASLDDVLDKVMKLAAGIPAPTNRVQEFNFRKQFLNKYAGFSAYNRENYEEAVKYLKEVADNGAPHMRDGRLYETLVRAYTALGRYDDALKYADAMVSTAPGYMKSRIKQQADILKERAAEAKAK